VPDSPTPPEAPSDSDDDETPPSPSPEDAHRIRQAALQKRMQLCRFFALGDCQRGIYCIFAHGEEELEVPPPESYELYKSKPCVHFGRGWCAQGSLCHFIHGEQADEGGAALAEQELDTQPPPDPGPCIDMPPSCSGVPQDEETKRMRQFDLLKRKQLCVFFVHGGCEKGISCMFAHGEEEIQPQ